MLMLLEKIITSHQQSDKTYTERALRKQTEKMPPLSTLWETEVMSLCQHKQTMLFPATVCDTFV